MTRVWNVGTAEDPILAEALHVFVEICRLRQIDPEYIFCADRTRHPWVFQSAIAERWSIVLGSDPLRRYAIDATGALHHATRTWTLRKVETWFQVPEGTHHLVSTGYVECLDAELRNEIVASLLTFFGDNPAQQEHETDPDNEDNPAIPKAPA